MNDPFAHHPYANVLPFRRQTSGSHVAQGEYDRLMTEISQVDDSLATLVTRRRNAAAHLSELAERYWPLTEQMRGYKAPSAQELPMPDAWPDAEVVSGRRLRSLCMTLLHRHGPCELSVLHRLLLLHGFMVGSNYPAKALSTAMSYEVKARRARRLARAVYDVRPDFHPRPGRHGAVPLAPGAPWRPGLDHDLPSASSWS